MKECLASDLNLSVNAQNGFIIISDIANGIDVERKIASLSFSHCVFLNLNM